MPAAIGRRWRHCYKKQHATSATADRFSFAQSWTVQFTIAKSYVKALSETKISFILETITKLNFFKAKTCRTLSSTLRLRSPEAEQSKAYLHFYGFSHVFWSFVAPCSPLTQLRFSSKVGPTNGVSNAQVHLQIAEIDANVKKMKSPS